MTDAGASPASYEDAKRRRVLASLTPKEREALYRFYNLRQDPRQISLETGMEQGELHELKSRVRKGFEETGRPR